VSAGMFLRCLRGAGGLPGRGLKSNGTETYAKDKCLKY
jgi:hypothetical protein